MQVLSRRRACRNCECRECGVRLARVANDRLAATVRAHPAPRFARSPPFRRDPKAAADELERGDATRLQRRADQRRPTAFDDKRFWPICRACRAALDALYLHPTITWPALIGILQGLHAQEWPMIMRAAWGFTVETATQGAWCCRACSTPASARRSSSVTSGEGTAVPGAGASTWVPARRSGLGVRSATFS